MTQQGKLVAKLENMQAAFTWQELEKLLGTLGYEKKEDSGSRVKFSNGDPAAKIILHKPHPGNEVKKYIRKEVRDKLKAGGLI